MKMDQLEWMVCALNYR